VYERITVREFLEFYADAYSVPDPSVVDAVIELTDLKKLADRLVVTLSKGNKQRLQVARILLHDPKVLILDEPASDLDPRARIEVRDLLLELRDLGKTIFLSSHILTELSDVCTSVGILEHGKLIVAGPIGEIAERLTSARAERTSPDEAAEGAAPNDTTAGGVVVPEAARRRLKLRVLGDSRAVAPLLQGGSGVLGVEPGPGGQILVSYTGDERFVAEVVRHLVASGVGIVAVEPERNELERIFLEVTRGELS
jgi:ABC-2 type transport system ATP-binding protein